MSTYFRPVTPDSGISSVTSAFSASTPTPSARSLGPGANVPKNLKYDQSDQSSLAELLLHKQAPEGRVSNFTPGTRIDFRFPTSGGYVDSMASSTLDFDLVVTNGNASDHSYYFDPALGAHQLIQRIVVTVGGNIIEDTDSYPIVYKIMKTLHDNELSVKQKQALSEDQSFACVNGVVPNFDESTYIHTDSGLKVVRTALNNGSNTASDAFVFNYDGDKHLFYRRVVAAGKTDTIKCRLNLLSCLGSLSGAKYWPSTLLNSDIRLEIYLNTLENGLTKGTSDISWQLNNVEFTLTRIRLNRDIIGALQASSNSGNVNMIMPAASHFQETVLVSSDIATNLKYSTSASSLKSIFIAFRDYAQVSTAEYHPYNFYDPIGMSYQFLVGSTLMPARPIETSVDKYRELMRCVGGPINSTEQKMLMNKIAFNSQPAEIVTDDKITAYSSPACHLIGQSLEMYADHTLSSVVFSGINAINMVLQAQLRILETSDTADSASFPYDRQRTKIQYSNPRGNSNKNFLVDSILVYDRLLRFQNGEVTMGY